MSKTKMEKELIAVLGALIAETANIRTGNGSDLHRAWWRAMRVYRKAVE